MLSSTHSQASSSSLLVIVLDVNPITWGVRGSNAEPTFSSSSASKPRSRRASSEPPAQPLQQQEATSDGLISFTSMLEHLLIFINAYLLTSRRNQIAIVGAWAGPAIFLYPEEENLHNKEYCPTALAAGEAIARQINQLIIPQSNSNQSSTSYQTNIPSALSKAILYASRKKIDLGEAASDPLVPRILLITADNDNSQHFKQILSCFFTAQQQSIVVDCCHLPADHRDASYLQQGVEIAGGLYIRPERQQGLSQYLLSVMMIDPMLRGTMQMPQKRLIDYRMGCHCHNRPVDQGLACPSCLTVYCEVRPKCDICGIKFLGAAPPQPQPQPQPQLQPDDDLDLT